MAAPLVIMATCPDAESADRLSRGLVEGRLAACVNVLPEVGSVYRWQGTIERSRETLLLIKTTCGRYEAVEAFICAGHPYELPEVIAVPIERGSAAYISWLEHMVSDAQ
ncbi:MAG: divalent-cation tolerance protein CutA [Pseudomonadota bacterium]|nr:divalent-cation tolerance protein CutA [Pseudomonadota bacterium]